MKIEDDIRATLRAWADEAPRTTVADVPTSRRSSRPLLAVGAAAAVVVAVVLAWDRGGNGEVVATKPGITTPAGEAIIGTPEWDPDAYRAAYQVIRGAPLGRLPLEDIDAGVSTVDVEGVPLWFVRDGSEVRAFLQSGPFDGARLTFCPPSGLFESGTHADKYDRQGRPSNDLAPRGMTLVPTYVEGDTVLVDLAGLAPGPPASYAERGEPPRDGKWCVQ